MNTTTETKTALTLGEIAINQPASTRVFLRHKLDYCCGGKKTLVEACKELGLDPKAIELEIKNELARGDDADKWEERSQSDLADHIEQHYHAGLRRDVPGLISAAARVEKVHAGKEAVPAGLAEVLTGFLQDMETHMRKEETVLFPMLRQGARGASVQMPIRAMLMEHDDHGATLNRIHQLTGNMELPAHACGTWKGLYEGLKLLEADLMQHIHLENNILFLRGARTA